MIQNYVQWPPPIQTSAFDTLKPYKEILIYILKWPLKFKFFTPYGKTR